MSRAIVTADCVVAQSPSPNGRLCVGWSQWRGRFSKADEQLVRHFCAHASVALGYINLHKRHRALQVCPLGDVSGTGCPTFTNARLPSRQVTLSSSL
eukprot:5295124-Pleurochrysis_carterae.AAC.9